MCASLDTFAYHDAATCPTCATPYDEQIWDADQEKAICSHCGTRFTADIPADLLDISIEE